MALLGGGGARAVRRYLNAAGRDHSLALTGAADAGAALATLTGAAAHLTLLRAATHLTLRRAAKHPALAMVVPMAAAGVERYDERDDAENQREPTAYGEQRLLNWI